MEDFSELQSTITKALLATTRTTGQIVNEDLPFHRSLEPSVGRRVDRQNARLLGLAENLLNLSSAAAGTVSQRHASHHAVGGSPEASTRFQQLRGKKRNADGEDVSLKLPDVDALEANWRGVVDVVDSLLERADINLDEYTGAVKRLTPTEGQQLPIAPPQSSLASSGYRDAKIAKPQLQFEHKPNNEETGLFQPLLKSKPHAVVPLEDSLTVEVNQQGLDQYADLSFVELARILGQKPSYPSRKAVINGVVYRHRHPYRTEIEGYQYPDFIRDEEVISYEPFESTAATFVDTPDALDAMIADLKQAKEIAIDLEHHDKHSYVGIVSLMQISTRTNDYVIDTLKPWRRRLEKLNEVFADPSIIKVLHGAYMDIVWLQRDFGVYVVGLFDTYHAARTLGYTGGSLAFLLQKFIDFQAQKQYQMADWRIRPLPQELFDYARSDTHFLLYIYSHMRNELLQKKPNEHIPDALNNVLEKSKETSLQVYSHPMSDSETGLGDRGWYRSLNKHFTNLTPAEFAVYRALHNWRDHVARVEDESPVNVIPQNSLLQIAKSMPEKVPDLVANVYKASNLLRSRASEVIGVIARAKKEGENGPTMATILEGTDSILSEQTGQKVVSRALAKPTTTAVMSPPRIRTCGGCPPRSAFLPTEALKMQASTFWGTVSPSLPPQSSEGDAGLQLAIPLPKLTGTHINNGVNGTDKSIPPAPSPVTPQPQAAANDEEFTVKQAGGKVSRRHQSSPTEATLFQPGDLDAAAASHAQDLASRPSGYRNEAKAARKATKKAAAEEKRTREKERQAQEMEVEPVDYSKAESVLHAKPEKSKDASSKKRKEKFDPFARAADAPEGAGGKRMEGKGRSGTFAR